MTKTDIIVSAFNSLRFNGVIKTQKDFANLLGVDKGQISKALTKGDKAISDNLVDKVEALLRGETTNIPKEWVKDFPALDGAPQERVATLPVIPTDAMAGTLGEFTASISEYDCERMVSPIKGADYAMKVNGDSMSPEFPNGSLILIKKVNEKAFIEWGKVYVLDTENGAVIKQIHRTENDGVVECVSLNPSYQPFTIDTSFINGWYRVLMVLATK